MTPEEARKEIEGAFSSVDSTMADSRFLDLFSDAGEPEGKRVIFRMFTNGGERIGRAPVPLCNTPEEAMNGLVAEVKKVADPNARLFWRQLPVTKYNYNVQTMKNEYVAICRLAWIPDVDRCVMDGGK